MSVSEIKKNTVPITYRQMYFDIKEAFA